MENVDRLLVPRPTRRRARSTGSIRYPQTTNRAGMGRLVRPASNEVVHLSAGNDASNSRDYLELLYNITDAVLFTCAGIVIVSCIASLILCGYGYYLA